MAAEFFLSAAVYGYFAGQFRCNSIAECVFQPVCLTALGGLWVYALPGAAMGAVDEFLAVFAGQFHFSVDDFAFCARYCFPIVGGGAFEVPPPVFRISLCGLDALPLYVEFSCVLIVGGKVGDLHGVVDECSVEDALVAQQAGAEEAAQQDGEE